MANILYGLQSHSSTWCDNESKQISNSFRNAGCDFSKAKVFGNVVHEPIISGHESTLVLDIIKPTELHLLLGVVNYLFKTLQDI